MPELPEVETYRKYFDRHALNKRIESVSHIDSYLVKDGRDPDDISSALRQAVFTGSRRHGKYILLNNQDKGYLVLHFGMTGYLRYLEDCSNIPSHTRFLLKFNDSCLALVDARRLGMIYLYEDIDGFLRDKKLGPDALSIKKDTFIERLSQRNKPVKSALMDQSIIAGIGNLYADEILFQSLVHPISICRRLDVESLELMYHNMEKVLTAAVDAEADIKKYPKDWLLSHRGKSANCPHCGGGLDMVKAGGRTTYFCPRKQKLSN